MSILHPRDAKAGTILRKVLSDVEAVEACVAKSIALEAERDRLKAINEEMVKTLVQIADDCHEVSLEPGIEHIEKRTWLSIEKIARAAARQGEAINLKGVKP